MCWRTHREDEGDPSVEDLTLKKNKTDPSTCSSCKPGVQSRDESRSGAPRLQQAAQVLSSCRVPTEAAPLLPAPPGQTRGFWDGRNGWVRGNEPPACLLPNVFAELHLGGMLLDKAAEQGRYQ